MIGYLGCLGARKIMPGFWAPWNFWQMPGIRATGSSSISQDEQQVMQKMHIKVDLLFSCARLSVYSSQRRRQQCDCRQESLIACKAFTHCTSRYTQHAYCSCRIVRSFAHMQGTAIWPPSDSHISAPLSQRGRSPYPAAAHTNLSSEMST